MYQNSLDRIKAIGDLVQDTIYKNIFPVETNDRILEIESTEPLKASDVYDKSFDISKHLDAKLKGRDLTMPVKATLVLRDKKTNKIIDRERVTLMDQPIMTNRGSFIYGGNDYHMVNQLRLKPGIYTRIKDNGEIESFFNLSKGGASGFSMWMDPESGKLNFKIGGKNPGLYSVMKALDVPDKELARVWGPELLELNAISGTQLEKDIRKVYESLYKSKADPQASLDKMKSEIKAFFDGTGLSEETTKITLGKGFDKITADALLRTSDKLIKVSKKEAEPDERDALYFKNIYSIEDLLAARIGAKAKEIKNKIKNNLNSKDEIKSIYSKDFLNKPVRSFLTQSSLSTSSDQTNPVAMANALTRTTLMGEGGISSLDIVTTGMRAVSDSHLGALDPSQTPESKRIGINLNLAKGAVVEDKEIKTRLINVKTGELETLRKIDTYDKHVAFPDQYDRKNKKFNFENIRVVYRGKTIEVPPSKVDYILPDASDMFSLGSNMIPFQADVQGNRTMMANKMSGQAISLLYREAPLVQVKRQNSVTLKDGSVIDTEERAAARIFNLKSPVDGEVVSVSDDYAEIKDAKSGKIIKVSKYNHFPMSDKSFMHAEFLIKKGDKVREGQLLAEDNFTKDQTLALGTNLNIAYIPFKDKTFEDGFVISESAAKKLTSLHLYTYKTRVGPDDKLGVSTYIQQFPSSITAEQQKKLDSNGIIKVGEEVHPGDILVALLHYREPNDTDIALGKLSKTLMSQYKDGGIRYDHDSVGKVERVTYDNNEINIHVSTAKAAEAGDKIVGRYGNKGIITAILPDEEMPVSETGVRADVVTSPYGVPGRINVGQIYETIAGKVAEKRGRPIKITNMDPNIKSNEELKRLADKYGVKTEEKMYDPKNGRLLAETSFGPQYIFKLKHMVEKKMTSRGPYSAYNSDEQPAKGGGSSARAMDRLTWNGLIAHGARENLREMATYKANKNPELWNKIRLGLPVPAPQTPFATEKLFSLMQAAGVNVKKDGQQLMLTPMTDDEILSKSNGAIDDAQVMMAKTLRPIKDGLFDDTKTGGLNGKKWTHIALQEPVVSPIMAPAAKTVLGMRSKDFDDISNGSKFINPLTGEISDSAKEGFLTGGLAIMTMLTKIDAKKELETLKSEAKTMSGDALDKANKKMRYLKALVDTGKSPEEAYIIHNVPVLPPHMRPIYSLPDGSLSTSPINFLYRDLIMINKELKDSDNLPDFAKKKLRADLVAAVKAVQGLGDPVVNRGEKKIIGALQTIKGDQPKEGYFQSVVFSKKQELSGQSTAAPSVDVSPDEVMLPKAMAWNLFEPFIHQELTKMGFSNMQAKQMIANRDPKAEIAMERVADTRPVWINRAPSLHKLNILAMRPKLYDGSSIKVNPLIVSGYNLDFDGDSLSTSVFAVVDINKIKNFTSSDNSGIINDMDAFINQREAYMPSKEIVLAVSDNEKIIHINLEDFPRIESTREITPSGNINYKVPDGISVFTLDNETREFVKCKVTDFSIHPDLEGYIVTTAQHETLMLSDDHSAVVFDFETGKLAKCRPDNLIGKAIPKARALYTEVTDPSQILSKITLTDYSEGKGKNLVKREVPITKDLGHFIGIMVGDGWVSASGTDGIVQDRHVCIASVEPGIVRAFEAGVNSLCAADKKIYSVPSPHKFDGHDCYSEKHTISNASVAGNIVEWIGKGAESKHLPVWFLNTPKEFRLGLLAGLIDTDGSACWVQAKSKKNPQFQLTYHTMSIRLAHEVITLARSLGITAKVTPYKNKYYNISFYNRDLYEQQLALPLAHAGNAQAYAEFLNTTPSKESFDKLGRTDLVPFGQIVFERIKKLLPGATRKKDRDLYQFCLYNTMKKALKTGCITRSKAEEIISFLSDKADLIPAFWRELVADKSVAWTYAVSVKKLPKRETMYDITVPGPYTFTTVDGIVVQDSLGVYVPVSSAAVEEAKNFMPSKILDDPRDYSVTLKPTHDIQLGLFALSSKGSKRTDKKYASLKEAETDFIANKINLNDIITINGYETTFGREKLREVLPEGVTIPDRGITKSDLDAFLRQVADKDPKNVNKRYADIAKVSSEYNLYSGIGLTLKDLTPGPEIMAPIKKKIKTEFSKLTNQSDKVKYLSNLVGEFSTTGKQWIKDNVWKNNLATMNVASGKPGFDSVKQLIFAPLAVKDENDNLVPTAVTRNYSEGVTASDFWVAASGARKGMIDRQLQTAEPGYFAKQMISVAVDQVISERDCGTKNGIDLDLSRDKIDILWRYDMKGRLIDNSLYENLLRSGLKTIKVRSPITCEANEGICQMCYGTKPGGAVVEIGANVGTEAGQVATERTTQLTMKTFHSGSVATSGPTLASGFERLQQLAHVPAFIKDRATLAKSDGIVTDIRPNPAGGLNIYINGERHFCPVDDALVKIGDKVTKGQQLTSGVIKPQELLATKGIRATQDYLIDEMQKTFTNQNVNLNRRAFETLVRATTNVTKVIDPADSEDFLPGDKVQLTKVLAYNKMNPYKPIKHEPELLGIDFSSKITDDWAAKLNTNRIQTVLQDAVASAGKSYTTSYNPVTPYIIGKDFGKGEKGKY